MKGDPEKITLRVDVKPCCITTAKSMALPILPKVKEELNQFEREVIIEKVTKPPDWCAPIVPNTLSRSLLQDIKK